MKKVGILTFHRADNYGAALQTYGLKMACEKLGCDVQVIDYRPQYIENQYKYFTLSRSVKKNIINLLNFKSNLSKRKKFAAFRKKYMDMAEFEGNQTCYDTIFYGSDQIWNPNIKGGFDEVFFASHNVKANKHCAYAASIGKSEFTQSEQTDFSHLLGKMDKVSLREKSSLELIPESLKDKTQVVLDPTVLNSKEQWQKIAQTAKGLPEKFIFVYQVARYPEVIKIANELSKKTGLPVVELLYTKTSLKSGHRIINDIGPCEFIDIIQRASYVVTSSFHGTAFSVIFKKQFYTVLHKTYGSRMVTF